MQKPFDLSKFRKSVQKNIDGVSVGFNDPVMWIHSGNYALNYLISSDFNRGIPLSKVSMFAGEPGSGKSLLCMGGIAKNAQEQGVTVVVLDSENALDEEWLKAAGLDTSEDKLIRLGVTFIDEVASVINEFMSTYEKENKDVNPSEAPPVLFIVDSLGMLLSKTEAEQFDKGDLKGDMGRKAKALKALVQRCVNMFAHWPVGMVCTNHVYASQDMYNPEDKISGGSGFVYASSIVASMKTSKLKGENKSDIRGIRSRIKINKSRHSKPFEAIELQIPYDKGIDEYSGLVELLEKMGILKQDGRKLTYTFSDGTKRKEFRTRWNKELLENILNDLKQRDIDAIVNSHLVNNENSDDDNENNVDEEDDEGDNY